MSQQSIVSSVIGGALLVAGSCIGAGMLGLPILAGLVGLLPSMLWLCVVWGYLLCTALLLAEANLWFPMKSINLLTLSQITLGRAGQLFAWITFVSLFYSLLVAYSVKAGQFVTLGLQTLSDTPIAPITGPILLMAACGLFVYFGARSVDQLNRVGMLGLIATYCYLIYLASHQIETIPFTAFNWSLSGYVIPFFIISFGFHNLIPSIKTYLKHNGPAFTRSIQLGSILPLVIYGIWILIIVSALPLEGKNGVIYAFHHGEIATEPLSRLAHNPQITLFAQGFAFFAIVTSILAQGLSLVDFLNDGLQYRATTLPRSLLTFLVFFPPLIFGQLDPTIFFKALEYAGGIAAIILFGIMPVLMIWRGRYHLGFHGSYQFPGGKFSLIIVLIAGCSVLILEIGKLLTWWEWPIP